MKRSLVVGFLALLAAGGPPAASASAPSAPAATPDLFSQTTLREFRVTFKDADWQAQLDRTDETGFVQADLEVDGVTYPGVGLRYKGNSSSRIGGKKKPFGLSMDAFHDGQKLYGYDTLNLNNSFLDPSYVREVLTYDALRPFLPTPRAAYAKLYLNGEYWGLYVLIQQLERSYTGDWFVDKNGILVKADAPAGMGGGAGPQPRPPFARAGLVEGEHPLRPVRWLSRWLGIDQQPPRPGGGGGFNSALTFLGEDLAKYRSAYEIKTAGITDTGYARLQSLTRQLDAPTTSGGLSDAEFPKQIIEQLDVDGALWYIAAHNLFMNFDSYYSGHNYFIYAPRTDPRWTVLSWDMNEAFGLFRNNGVDGTSSAGLSKADPFLAATDPARPLIRRLFNVPAFRAAYLAHYRTLAEKAMDPAMLETRGKALQKLIRAAVEADPNKLYDLTAFDKNLMEDVTNGGQTPGGGGPARAFTPGVVNLARQRQDWVLARPDMGQPDLVLATHAISPTEPMAGRDTQLSVSFSGADLANVKSIDVVYRVDGGSPHESPISSLDGSTWQGYILGQNVKNGVAYYVRALLADGRMVFWPDANWTDPWHYRVRVPPLPPAPNPSIVLNELMADNTKTIADEKGEFDDWVEIVNRGSQAIPMDRYRLGPSEARAWDYAFPDVLLKPGEQFLVWCDGDVAAGENHAPFKLSKGGDQVVLATNGYLEDQVSFSAQATDVSWARLTDGQDPWGPCRSPSPGQRNRCGQGGSSTRRIYLPAARR